LRAPGVVLGLCIKKKKKVPQISFKQVAQTADLQRVERFCDLSELSLNNGLKIQGKAVQKKKGLKNPNRNSNLSSDSGGIRTPNQQNRNLSFYPIELRSLKHQR
jgi:hypothetical protein